MSYHEVPLVVTDQLVTALVAHVRQIKTLIGSIDLSADDLKKLPKMGKRRYTFCKDALEFAQMYPNILFMNRSAANFDRLKTSYDKLSPVLRELTQVYRTLQTIVTVLGSNVLVHGFSTYDAIVSSGNDTEPGIEAAREVLSAYFKGQGVDQEPTEEPDELIPGNDKPVNGGAPLDGNAPV